MFKSALYIYYKVVNERFCLSLHRIPLVHMESGLEKLFRQGADVKLVEGLYNMNKAKAKPSRVIVQDGKPVPTNDTLNLFKYFQVSVNT